MIRRRIRLAVCLGSLIACANGARSMAAPPEIKGVQPFGVQKGAETEVTFNGAHLSGRARLVAPFDVNQVPVVDPNTDNGVWKVKLNVPASTPLGTYPIRVQTEDGLSNPFLLTVGQFPQVGEIEVNNAPENAQVVNIPIVIEGQAAGNDVDFFRFTGKKGQRITIDAQCSRIGSGVDPTIRLTTAAGKYIASADDSPGLLTDAQLLAELPEDTDYVVELSDSRYQGGKRPTYRLTIGEVPFATEVFPIGARRGEPSGFELRGGSLAQPLITGARADDESGFNLYRLLAHAAGSPSLEVESIASITVSDLLEVREPADADAGAPPVRVATPVAINGRIDPAGDEDRFVVSTTPGQILRIKVAASDHASALDGILQILGANNAVLATADDTTSNSPASPPGKPTPILSPDPSIDFTVPANTHEITLALRDLQSRGGVGFPYRITVEPVTPTFELALSNTEISVPKGGTALVGVTIVRKGYTGPITLDVLNPPPGLTVKPGLVAAGQLVGTFSVSASADASFAPLTLKVVGRAETPAGTIVVPGQIPLVFAQQGVLPTNLMTQQGLGAAPALPPVLALEGPKEPIEVVHGYGTTLPLKFGRPEGKKGALEVTPLPLPPGLTIPALKIAEGASEGPVAVNAAVETALGTMTIGLTAKGTIDKTAATLAFPAVTLNVIRPAELQLTTPSLELKAGANVELKGKVVRKGPFKEPVTIKLAGLPAGVKADPLTLAPNQSEFTISVVADAGAKPAEAKPNVGMGFQINKKDYPIPTVPLTLKVVAAK